MVKSVITSFRWTVNGKAGRPALGAHVARAWGSPLSPGDIGRARPLIRGPRCPRREVGRAGDVKVPVPRGGRGNTWEAPKRGLAPGAARRGAGAPETAGLRDVWGRRVGVRGLYRGVWGSGRGALWGDRRTARVPTGPPGPGIRVSGCGHGHSGNGVSERVWRPLSRRSLSERVSLTRSRPFRRHDTQDAVQLDTMPPSLLVTKEPVLVFT